MIAALNLDRMETDLWNLYHQLDAVVEIMQGLDHPRPQPDAQTEQDRADAMAWVARDLARTAAKAIGKAIDEQSQEASTDVDVIRTLGEEYEEALVAWTTASEKADEFPDSAHKAAEKAAEKVHDQYRDSIFAFRPKTERGYAAKASILLRIRDRADGMTDDRIVQLLQSMGGVS